MAYVEKPATYQAIQWDGTNEQDCLDFAVSYLVQYPGEPPYRDTSTDDIVQPHTGRAAVNDWLVSGPQWGANQWNAPGRILTATDFADQYEAQ